jgi:uncharacterized cupredoxin-like copper-binding protein
MESPSDTLVTSRGRGATATLAVFIFGVLILAGCSSPTASTAAGTTVKATLTEWAVVLDKASVPAGDVKFEVTNAGTQFKHEFVVIKTDLAPDALPATDGKVEEEGSGIGFIGELEELEIGASGSVSFPLTAGKYVLICNIVETGSGHESHYNQGMRAVFTVN